MEVDRHSRQLSETAEKAERKFKEIEELKNAESKIQRDAKNSGQEMWSVDNVENTDDTRRENQLQKSQCCNLFWECCLRICISSDRKDSMNFEYSDTEV